MFSTLWTSVPSIGIFSVSARQSHIYPDDPREALDSVVETASVPIGSRIPVTAVLLLRRYVRRRLASEVRIRECENIFPITRSISKTKKVLLAVNYNIITDEIVHCHLDGRNNVLIKYIPRTMKSRLVLSQIQNSRFKKMLFMFCSGRCSYDKNREYKLTRALC